LTAKNALFTPVYAAYIQKLPWRTFMKAMLPAMAASLTIAFLMYSIAQIVPIHSWIALGGFSGLVGLAYGGIVYFGVLRPEDRALLWTLLRVEKLQPWPKPNRG